MEKRPDYRKLIKYWIGLFSMKKTDADAVRAKICRALAAESRKEGERNGN